LLDWGDGDKILQLAQFFSFLLFFLITTGLLLPREYALRIILMGRGKKFAKGATSRRRSAHRERATVLIPSGKRTDFRE
jgi:hypothetical protein